MKLPSLLMVATGILVASCGSFPSHSVTPTSLKHDQIVVVAKLQITPGLESAVTAQSDANPNILPDSAITTKNDIEYWVYLTPSKDLAQKDLTDHVMAQNGDTTTQLINTKSTLDYTLNNETMLMAAPQAKELYLVGFMVGLRVTEAYFPAAYTIQVPDGAKAIYIGTFSFTRNRYLEVTGVKHLDEYDQAVTDFQKKFPGVELVRADVVPTASK